MNVLQEDTRIYDLEVSVTEDIFKGINKRLIKEFESFKRSRKLEHCVLRQDKPKGNTIRVTWLAIKHYKQRLVDVAKIEKDLELINLDNDQASIGNIYTNDTGCMVEFEIVRNYNVKVVV